MARYIDAELLKEKFAKRLNNHFGIVIKIDDVAVDLGLAIADTPTADVVEVVRCEKCKYGMKSWLQPSYIEKQYLCRKDDSYQKPNHFCSYGERSDT